MFNIEQCAHICGIDAAKVKEYMDAGYLESDVKCFNMKHVERIRLIQQMASFEFKREDIEMVLEGKMAIDDILKLRIYEIENSIERASQLIEKIRKTRHRLEQGNAFISVPQQSEPYLEIVPERWGCSVRQRIHSQAINYLLRRLQDKMNAFNLKPAGNLIRIIHEMAPSREYVDMELFFPVELTKNAPREELKSIPETQVVSVDVVGRYKDLSLGYATLFRWLEDHPYRISGLGMEVFRCGVLTKEGTIPQIQLDAAKDPMQFDVKISLPIESI